MSNEVKDLDSKSDEELMELYKAGSMQAFELIYKRYAGRIVSYLRKKTNNDRKVQDLAQETFLKLHRSREQYNRMLPLAPWIFSVTRSVLLDSFKKKSLEDLVSPEKLDLQVANDSKSTEINSEWLESLPEIQRQVVNLRVVDDQTFEEIAKRLSTSPQNARQIFSRGLRKLRMSVGGKG